MHYALSERLERTSGNLSDISGVIPGFIMEEDERALDNACEIGS